MRVLGSIEARMGSSRLTAKTLMEVWNGRPLLDLVVNRFRRCANVDEVQVATTDRPGDDAVADWCCANGVRCFRGSEDDVLDRVAKAAQSAGADAVVQMGGDSAYLDSALIDQLVTEYRGGGWDYVCNDLEPGYPLGIYGHVVSARALAELNARAGLTSSDRDDVVRYIWEHPGEYRIRNIAVTPEYAAPQLRLTIDYPEDMELARAIYSHFRRDDFTTRDVIALSQTRPELFAATVGLKQRSAPFLKKTD